MKKIMIILAASAAVAGGAFIAVKSMNPLPFSKWHYQLQADEQLIPANRSREGVLFVIDYSRDGTLEEAFTKKDVAALRNGGANRVVSYMSIGESEAVRWYFGELPKELKGRANPNWPDNYIVPYWKERWQEIIMGDGNSYLNQIQRAGFDGVYLDIVDGYQNYPDRPTAAAEMIAFIERISRKAKSRNPGFLIIPQNAPCITDRENFQGLDDAAYKTVTDRYWAAIDGVALEDTFFFGDQPMNNPYAPQKNVLRCIEGFHTHGKFILGVDYVDDPEKKERALKEFKNRGILGLVTDRLLKGTFFEHPD